MTLLGGDAAELEKFRDRRSALISYCIEKGGRHKRIDWNFVDRKTLDLQKIHRVRYAEPVDEHWDWQTYVSETAGVRNWLSLGGQ